MILFPTVLTNTRNMNLIGTGFIASFHSAQQNGVQESCIVSAKSPWLTLPIVKNFEPKSKMKCAKIAIIGGGLCGVTAARSISKKCTLSGPDKQCEITVIEADPMSLHDERKENRKDHHKSLIWKAAAARNANSLVPGAAMHIMSQREVIYRILKDFIGVKHSLVFNRSPEEDFSEVPQYFVFDLFSCIGFNIPWVQKVSFFSFLFHFLKTSIFDNESGIKSRGKHLVQLANANRKILEEDELFQKLGRQSGFISVHRSMKNAVNAVAQLHEFGEDGELISSEEAKILEPRLKSIPFQPSYFVHRPNDSSANCHAYLISSLRSLISNGVKYENAKVTEIRVNQTNGSKDRFTIYTSEGDEMTYDYVIVANGINAPILMYTMGFCSGLTCPVYPLKGYSFTMTSTEKIGDNDTRLHKAISFDNIYCTSVYPNRVRMAGFGEISGWPSSEKDYCESSSLAKDVFGKYARALFQDDMEIDLDQVLPCYRPMSPDDIPIVGEVKSIKGLYVHTGHTTLGWTLCLATAECLAQIVCDDINGTENPSKFFILPDGTQLKKSILSPDRFL